MRYFPMQHSFSRLCWAAIVVLVMTSAAAYAQSYPTKSVRLIVPSPAGGGNDIMTRILAEPLSETWGQPIVVDNRPGAGIMVGTEIGANSTPDGYTILFVNANLAPNGIAYKKLPLVRNLMPVILVATVPQALSVNASLPVHSVKDLIAVAKSSKLSYSSVGNGTLAHLSAEMLKLAAGINLLHVPYKGGPPAMSAIIAGEVSMGFASLVSALNYQKTGKLRIIAVTSGKRSPAAPNIPTISETLPEVVIEGWTGYVVPSGTPPNIIRKINSDILKLLRPGKVRDRLVAYGFDVQGSTPEQFGKLIQSDIAKFSEIFLRAHIETF